MERDGLQKDYGTTKLWNFKLLMIVLSEIAPVKLYKEYLYRKSARLSSSKLGN